MVALLTSSSGSSTTGTVSVSHTINAATTNTIVIVSFGLNYGLLFDQALQSVTYGGVAMTPVTSTVTFTNGEVRMYYLVNPPTGTQSAIVTFDLGLNMVVGVSSFSGVHQTNPFGQLGTGQTTSAAASTTLTGTRFDSVCIDVVAVYGTLTAVTIATTGTSQASQYNAGVGASPNRQRGGGSTQTGAGVNIMSWSLSASKSWGQIVAEIVPAYSNLAHTAAPSHVATPAHVASPSHVASPTRVITG